MIDSIFLVYFISHIPITICIDGQGFLPEEYYPKVLRDTLDWYVSEFGDPLMKAPQALWFKSIVGCELFLQLPFFFVAVYAFMFKCNWIRIPGIVYGAHVATTMAPILVTIVDKGEKVAMLLGFYLPSRLG
eukprot:Nk52_evm6s248 gene=Nk52_evmTU6s248